MSESRGEAPDIRAAFEAVLTRREMLRRLGLAGGLLVVPGVVADAAQAGSASRLSSAQSRSVSSIKFGFPETITSLDPAAAPTAAAENATANSAEALLTLCQRRQPGSAARRVVLATGSHNLLLQDPAGRQVLRRDPDDDRRCRLLVPANVERPDDRLRRPLRERRLDGGRRLHELVVKLKSPSNTFKYLATFLFIGKKSTLAAAGEEPGHARESRHLHGPLHHQQLHARPVGRAYAQSALLGAGQAARRRDRLPGLRRYEHRTARDAVRPA